MSDFNRLEFVITYDHSLLGPQVTVEASWFDADGEECSDYCTVEADNADDALTEAVAWLEENCEVTTHTSRALAAASETLVHLGGMVRGEL